MWLVATTLDSTDIEHFYYLRKFCCATVDKHEQLQNVAEELQKQKTDCIKKQLIFFEMTKALTWKVLEEGACRNWIGTGFQDICHQLAVEASLLKSVCNNALVLAFLKNI